MHDLLAITKALADANRIRILCALQGRELCVCQLQELLELAPSTTSKHLAILAAARLVEYRREGRWAYYRLAASEPMPCACDILGWVARHTEDDRVVGEDRARLARILDLSPEALVRLQARGERCCSPGTCGPSTADTREGT